MPEQVIPASAAIMVSAHLDDAALSASARLGEGGALVVTVFTALPPDGWPVTSWDRLTGATDSRERQLERYAEDAGAMAILGASYHYLDQPERLYREGPPDLAGATAGLGQILTRAAGSPAIGREIWLPAAIGGHPDHRLARDIGLAAVAEMTQFDIFLYADFPYLITHGWPANLTGRASDPLLDADSWLADQLRRAGLDPAALTPRLTILDADQRARKAAVIAAYRSQAPALRLGAAELAVEPAKLAYELSWKLESSFAAKGVARCHSRIYSAPSP